MKKWRINKMSATIWRFGVFYSFIMACVGMIGYIKLISTSLDKKFMKVLKYFYLVTSILFTLTFLIFILLPFGVQGFIAGGFTLIMLFYMITPWCFF
jgi:hypothetical protein